MKLAIIFSFIFCLVIPDANADASFLKHLRSGKTKRSRPKNTKSSANFLQDLRSGKIKRSRPKNMKPTTNFLQDLRNGRTKRGYAGKSNRNSNGNSNNNSNRAFNRNNNPSQKNAVPAATKEVKRGKSLGKSFWGN